jgi:hypothetical protein
VISYRDNIDLLPESAVKHIEETWSNLRNNYYEIINNSKRIRNVLETVDYSISLIFLFDFVLHRNLNNLIYYLVILIVLFLINVNK